MLIRQACAADVPQLLALMRELAAFEDYLAQFAVDEQALRQRAFGPAAQCQVYVAEAEGELLGYALALLIPFTYDLRPTARLKELHVRPAQRSSGLGRQSLVELANWAIEQGAGRLHWAVLSGNARAESFYQRLGGRPVQKWIAYEMDDAALQRLARG
ncbi:GNAT family N-acetyltransferase [Aquipseudomonas alcaligenes]|uniref:GNAT family N-acetyltransferase n=1 Tax=Aquipseudomonas alcaligenes TaxID=43263 RepID=A0AB73HVI3_AQUAC|nr:GNAT family N-acetyltransferase [Pseudomonas alcaligenes]MDH0141468.1 GNAT family N-acetyltransferase [Pseudomonas alcaligenes]